MANRPISTEASISQTSIYQRSPLDCVSIPRILFQCIATLLNLPFLIFFFFLHTLPPISSGTHNERVKCNYNQRYGHIRIAQFVKREMWEMGPIPLKILKIKTGQIIAATSLRCQTYPGFTFTRENYRQLVKSTNYRRYDWTTLTIVQFNFHGEKHRIRTPNGACADGRKWTNSNVNASASIASSTFRTIAVSMITFWEVSSRSISCGWTLCTLRYNQKVNGTNCIVHRRGECKYNVQAHSSSYIAYWLLDAHERTDTHTRMCVCVCVCKWVLSVWTICSKNYSARKEKCMSCRHTSSIIFECYNSLGKYAAAWNGKLNWCRL